MRLRCILTFLLVLLILPGLRAQKSKVIERSAKTVPQWLSDRPTEYLVVDLEAPDMASAEAKAMQDLAARVVMAVATNVMHTSSTSARTETVNGSLSESETFGYDTEVAAANIPFIKGISLSEAADTYWEKLREAKTDRIYYRFAVLYPFPQAELTRMRQEFDRIDSEKSAQLQSLADGLHDVRKSTDIEEAITALETLEAYFFDNVRRAKAVGLRKDYKGLYKGLTLHTTKPADGAFIVTVMLDGHPFSVAGLPALKANCASQLEARPLPDGEGYEVTYSDTDCIDDDENWIDVSWRLRDTKLSKRVYL